MYVMIVDINEIYNILQSKKIQKALYSHEVQKMTKNLVFSLFFQLLGTKLHQKYIMWIFIRKLYLVPIK